MFINTNLKLLLSADAACSVLLTVFLLPLVLLALFFGRPHLDATPSTGAFSAWFEIFEPLPRRVPGRY